MLALYVLLLVMACTRQPNNNSQVSTPTPHDFGLKLSSKVLVGDPCGVEVIGSETWVVSCQGKLLRVNLATGAVRPSQLSGAIVSHDGVLADESGFWALLVKQSGGRNRGVVEHLDPSTLPSELIQLGSTIPVHATRFGGRLWVATVDGRILTLASGASTQIVGPGKPLSLIAVDSSSVWTVGEDGDVTLRDRVTAHVRHLYRQVAPEAISLLDVDGRLLVAPGEGGLLELNTQGREQRLNVRGRVNDMELCQGSVWLSQPEFGGALAGRFGLRSMSREGKIQRTIQLEVGPRYISCNGASLVVLSEDGRLGSIAV
jgi:hypothetical protein